MCDHARPWSTPCLSVAHLLPSSYVTVSCCGEDRAQLTVGEAARAVVARIEDKRIVTTYYRVERPGGSRRSVRIVQVSDLHEKQFGKGGTVLLARIREQRPDIIALTGDLLNHRRGRHHRLAAFLRELRRVAPLYIVTGNHEFSSREWSTFRGKIKSDEVILLENRAMEVTCSGDRRFAIAGIEDFRFFRRSLKAYRRTLHELAEAAASLPRPLVLLAHRPEHFAHYAKESFDLVLSGHAHGGQVQIPGIGPVFAPDEGLFPKLVQGMHHLNGSTMIVSRGLGPSRFPLRIFNRPELVVIDLTL